MEILKISLFGIVTAVLYVLIRHIKPEFASLVVLGGVGVILVMLSDSLVELISGVDEMMNLAGIEKENVSILIKGLSVCVISQFAADICYDNSCSSIASAIELAGRLSAIILSIPMLKTVAQLAIGLING